MKRGWVAEVVGFFKLCCCRCWFSDSCYRVSLIHGGVRNDDIDIDFSNSITFKGYDCCYTEGAWRLHLANGRGDVSGHDDGGDECGV